MVVIADTSPLNYLILIDEIEVLPRLYGRVVIPSAVWQEMQSREAPALVTQWAAVLPAWAEVQTPPAFAAAAVTDPMLARLGKGEREALLLAQQVQGESVLLLMDERLGRREAGRRQFQAVGTLGILRAAAVRGWVNLPTCFARLRQTNFREPHAVMAELLAEDAERKQDG